MSQSTFVAPPTLEARMAEITWRCDECGAGFATTRELDAHVANRTLPPDTPTITLRKARRRFGLDYARYEQLRAYLTGRHDHSVRRGQGVPYRYALDDVRQAVEGLDRAGRSVGRFPPSPDLHHCRCGRMWISREALERHLTRDCTGMAPRPVERDRDAVIAGVRAELGRTARPWRQYPELRGGG